MLMMTIYIGLMIAVAHLVLGLILWLRVRKLYSYPQHFGFPILGNLYHFYRTLLIGSLDSGYNYMHAIADKNGKNGLCFHWLYGYKMSVVIFSPQIVKELAFHPKMQDKPYSVYGGLETYVEGPFSSCASDELWKVKRKEYNIFLKRSHIDNNYYNNFIKCGNKLVELMLASPSAVDIHRKTIALILDVTSETLFFGVETSMAHHPKVIDFMSKINNIASFFFGNPELMKLIEAIIRPTKVDILFFRELAELRKMFVDHASAKNQCPLAEQTLSMAIASRITKYKQSKKILENSIHEVFATASHTVSVVLSYSIISLAYLPDIQEKAWQEQFEIFDNDVREPTMDDLGHMNYLDRFIKEALRFVAPPFVGKYASEDININGVTIPQGTSVTILMKHIRMNSKLWKNPNVFDPDRFLEESDLLKHMYTPFGIGVRNCPGNHFATVMIKVVLSKMLRRLKVRPVDDKIRFEEFQYKHNIMTEVENPPMIQAEERI